MKLDGSAAGSLAAGIFIDPDSNGAHIGGSNLADRNVISNNGTGLDILGADDAVIQGNFFGVKPDGQTAAGNTNKDIEITDSTAGAGFKAENNEIGRQLSPGAPPTLECDEGCNGPLKLFFVQRVLTAVMRGHRPSASPWTPRCSAGWRR